MARYVLTAPAWFPDLGRLDAGEEIEWDGPQGSAMRPVEPGKGAKGPVKVARAKRVVHDAEEEALRHRGPGRSTPYEPPPGASTLDQVLHKTMQQPQAGDEKLAADDREAVTQQRGPGRSKG